MYDTPHAHVVEVRTTEDADNSNNRGAMSGVQERGCTEGGQIVRVCFARDRWAPRAMPWIGTTTCDGNILSGAKTVLRAALTIFMDV